MGQITVDLPDELRKQIDEFGCRIDMSVILRRAVEQELPRLRLTEDIQSEDMTRLRDEKANAYESQHYAEGEIDGTSWALKASYEDLAAIAKLTDNPDAFIASHNAGDLTSLLLSAMEDLSLSSDVIPANQHVPDAFAAGFIWAVWLVFEKL